MMSVVYLQMQETMQAAERKQSRRHLGSDRFVHGDTAWLKTHTTHPRLRALVAHVQLTLYGLDTLRERTVKICGRSRGCS